MKRLGISLACSLLISCGPDPAPIRPAIPNDSAVVSYGRELTHGLAACGSCHGETSDSGSALSGGRTQSDRYGEVAAANITPSQSGIGGWNTDQIMQALRGAVRPDGKVISKDLHAPYEWMSDEDAIAISQYLRTTPPVQNEVARRDLGFWERNTTGLFHRQGSEVAGHVPSVDAGNRLAFGKYLVDHVAACVTCHNGDAGLLEEPVYMGGGKAVSMGGVQKIAPEISGSKEYGIGSWSQGQIVNYLKSGETPDGRQIDARFCPVGFYSQADDEMLAAIADYLVTIK